MNGIIKRVESSLDSSEVVSYVPHTLFPSPFPRRLYDMANEMQESINELMLKVANDEEFLTTSLRRYAEGLICGGGGMYLKFPITLTGPK